MVWITISHTEGEKEVLKLKKFITEHREKGISDEHITKILVKKGLDSDIIERLFPKQEQLSDAIAQGVFKGSIRVIALIVGTLMLIYAIFSTISIILRWIKKIKRGYKW